LHDILNTEKADLEVEVAWPQGFKKSVREGLHSHISEKFLARKAFSLLHGQSYEGRFDSYQDFVAAIATLIVIGAEKGADFIWVKIINALEVGEALPSQNCYARSLWPLPVPQQLRVSWHKRIFDEYIDDHKLSHLFEDHYGRSSQDFSGFVSLLAGNLVNGITNGAEDAMANIYRCFMQKADLPVGRRNPRLLKSW
jgi:hypothetical protein